MKLLSLIKKLTSNKVILYMVTRYATYGLAFVNSILIAAKLGPYYMGIWGFILLIINYFAQIHFGIGSSLNVLLAQHKENKKIQDKYTLNSLVLTSYLALLVLLFTAFIAVFKEGILGSFNIYSYLIWIAQISIMQYYNIIFMNLFRIHNMIGRIALFQSFQILLQLVAILIFDGEFLVNALVFTYYIANILNVIVAIRSGVLPNFNFNELSLLCQKSIIKKGVLIFVYNSSFMFIILTIRTLISQNYTVDEFGIFSFSFTVANSLILILDALSFLIYPKILYKLSSKNKNVVIETIGNLRTYYISSATLIIMIALMLFPLLTSFLPQYKDGITSLYVISLATLINSFNYGYTSMLIAQNKEKFLATLSFIVLIINVSTALVLIHIFNVSYHFVPISIMVSYGIFCLVVTKAGHTVLRVNRDYKKRELVTFSKLGLPCILAIIICLLKLENFIWIPFVVYLILNISDIKKMLNLVRKIILTPNLFNL